MEQQTLACPSCKSPNYIKRGKRKDSNTYRLRCKDCGKNFSNRTAVKGMKVERLETNNFKYEATGKGSSLEGNIQSETTDKAKLLSEFLALHKVDLNEWEVERYTIGAHDVTMSYRNQDLSWDTEKTEKGTSQQLMTGYSERKPDGVTKTNYSIKVYLKPKKKEPIEVALLEFIKEIPTINHLPEIKYGLKKKSGVLLEMATFDAHIGKLATISETGYRNYDVDLSLEDLEYAVDKNLNWATTQCDIEEIEYIVGQDMWHVDNMKNHTTNGDHTMDVDGRMPKIMQKALRVIYDSILKCRQVAPVTVRWIPGNHDYFASMMVCASIDAYFSNDPNVTVDLYHEKNGMMTRKARLWGQTLVGWTHRIKGRENTWGNELAQAFPDLWGKSTFREWHCGDQHLKKTTKTMPEFTAGGVLIRQLTALSPVDKWHFENLFTDAVPGGEAFLWDKKYGVFGNYVAWTGQYEQKRKELVEK